jgi:HAD superfamily hydrolase (TIGR01662 family)
MTGTAEVASIRRSVDLVLFDRDGTLVHDVPYNGDPSLVRTVDGAPAVLRRARRRVAVGLVTNQSGVAAGRITAADVGRVNDRLEELVGPFDVVRWCPHAAEDGCACRKPAPGMVLDAADALGIRPSRVVVVGDVIADVLAAEAAGGVGILVPNARTLPGEVAAARLVAPDLGTAVDLVLGLPC